MTYRTDCLGEKFFRDMEADCGETAVRPCRCGGTQNSAAMLYSVFGSGTPITAPPTVSITSPADGGTVTSVVHATAAAQRGVATVALFINGSRYAFAFSDVPYGSDGQPAADYVLQVPSAIPKGTLGLVVTAADDLGISTDSTAVTVSNGPPCTQDSDCLATETCTGSTGECVYPPPAIELGSACSYDQECTTWECGDFSSGQACTTDCEVDSPTSCPAAFTCVDSGSGHGLCGCSPAAAATRRARRAAASRLRRWCWASCSGGDASRMARDAQLARLVNATRARHAGARHDRSHLGRAADDPRARRRELQAVPRRIWLETDKAVTNYRWGGLQCKGRDLSDTSVQVLFAAFRSEYQVKIEYVVTDYVGKQYRCVTGFTVSKS